MLGSVTSKFSLVTQCGARPRTRAAATRPPSRTRRHSRHRVGCRVLLTRMGPPVGDRPGCHVRLLRASGFLITALLVEERSTTGRVSLENFFARRALRLLPALCFCLAGWFAVVLAMRGHALDDHSARRREGNGHVPTRRPRRGRRCALVHHELGLDMGMVLGLRAARASVVPGRGGAVLSPLVARGGPYAVLPLAGRGDVGSRTGCRHLLHRRRAARRTRNVARARHEHRHAGR